MVISDMSRVSKLLSDYTSALASSQQRRTSGAHGLGSIRERTDLLACDPRKHIIHHRTIRKVSSISMLSTPTDLCRYD